MAQTAARKLQITPPSTLESATDGNTILLISMLEKAAQDMRDMFSWSELQKEFLFTLATSTEYYNLPGDFNGRLSESLWNRNQRYPLLGPIDAVEWQQYKSGLITTLPRQRFRFRVKNFNRTIYIDPTPSSTENGQICALEYIAGTVFRPKLWTASTSWLGEQYCSYNGNIYDRGVTTAATTGTTPPTHTTGAVSDGSVTWTFYDSAYETIISDTDVPLLDTTMIADGAVWMFKRERGFPYEELKIEWDNALTHEVTKLKGSSVLSIGRGGRPAHMIGWWSYPEGNYGI